MTAIAWTIALVLIAWLIYMLPFYIAHWRKRNNQVAFFIVCLLVDWSIIGWVVMLVVALSGESGKEREVRESLRLREVEAIEKLAGK